MRSRAAMLLLDYTPKSWGSREEFHKRLAVKLIERGNVAVLVLANPAPPHVEQQYQSVGIRLVYFNYTKLGKAGFLRLLKDLLRDLDIRMVHIRYFDYFSLLPWMLRLNGIRFIFFTEANSGVVRSRGVKLSLLRLRTAFVTQPLSRLIAISDYIRRRLITVGVPSDKAVIVFNGVDDSELIPNEAIRNAVRGRYSISAEEFVIFWMAELRPMKRLDVALRAVDLLRQKGIPVRFLVAGEGVLRKEMETLAEELGIADRVVWMGFCQKPADVIPAGDVFLLPSEGEAFGFVITEAMCCGLPVVGAKTGAIPELITDGETGFLAEPGNPEAFASALESLARDPALRQRMGSTARQRAVERFSLDVSVENTLRVYDSVSHA